MRKTFKMHTNLNSVDSKHFVYSSDNQTEGQRRKKVLKAIGLLDTEVSAVSKIDQIVI